MVHGRARHLLARRSTHRPTGGTRRRVRAHSAGLRQLVIDVQRIVVCGDTVLAEARYPADVKATGKRLDVQVAHVWDFRDGRVVRWQQYTDTWQFAQVTGVTPAN